MRNLMAMALCLVALPVAAVNQHSFGGVWKITNRFDPTFKGVLLIDQEGRAIWETSWDPEYRRRNNMTPVGIGEAKSFGYIEATEDGGFNVILTDKSGVERSHCAPHKPDVVLCAKGANMLTRVAPAPKSLMPLSQ